MAANFTNNQTVTAFSEYVSDGFTTMAGSSLMLGLILLLLLVVFCIYAGLSADSSVFIVFIAVGVLSFYGWLPQAVFLVALLIAGGLAAWVLYKSVRT